MASPFSTTPGRQITVCLVEDHVLLRDQLVELFANAGLAVLAAVGTVRQGQSAIIRELPDIAVIDDQLPDGRGVDLCRDIHTAAPHVRLILHSSLVTADEEREALVSGAIAVIPKSIRAITLLAAIRRHTNSSI